MGMVPLQHAGRTGAGCPRKLQPEGSPSHSLCTLCPFACPLMLCLAWVLISIGFLKHTPILIEAWPTSSKQSVRRHNSERPEQARMGCWRHVVQFHAVGQSWVHEYWSQLSTQSNPTSTSILVIYNSYSWSNWKVWYVDSCYLFTLII